MSSTAHAPADEHDSNDAGDTYKRRHCASRVGTPSTTAKKKRERIKLRRKVGKPAAKRE